MTGDTSDMFRFSWLPVVLYVFAASLLAGCGDLNATGMSGTESGSGMIISGVGTGGTGVVRSSLQAPAFDTGLIGAVVFVDKNGNRQPDPDEPSVVTGPDGSYSGLAEADSYPVLIQAVAGTTVVKATGQVVTGSSVVERGQ